MTPKTNMIYLWWHKGTQHKPRKYPTHSQTYYALEMRELAILKIVGNVCPTPFKTRTTLNVERLHLKLWNFDPLKLWNFKALSTDTLFETFYFQIRESHYPSTSKNMLLPALHVRWKMCMFVIDWLLGIFWAAILRSPQTHDMINFKAHNRDIQSSKQQRTNTTANRHPHGYAAPSCRHQ